MEIALFLVFSPGVSKAEQLADSTWAGVTRYVAVNPGTSVSAWEDASRSLVTNGAVQMTAVGDGTYRALLQLTPKATYNFIFFAKTGGSPPTGLQANTTYYDVIPTGGNIQSGTQPLKVTKFTDTTVLAPVRYGTVGATKDARRILDVPKELVAGDTLYVYANFGDRPVTISSFDVQPVDTTTVRLTWGSPYGNWGQNGESFKSADVIAGGTYKIYRNNDGSTTAYTFISQVSGTKTSYTDTNLTANTTYYYVITAQDAYAGDISDSPFQRGISDTTAQDSAMPRAPVRVRFKVHDFNWDYVKSHGCVVYLTPATEEDIFFARRVVGLIRRVDL